jgi:group I intron endonuclease
VKGIYKITNPNNKIYIGQSTNINDRIKRYKSLQCKGQRILYNSLKKYGWDTHHFEIIEIIEDETKLIERETYWKTYYKVLEIPSLCCKIDGKGGKLSIDSCEKLSKSIKSYWNGLTDEEYVERIKNHKQSYETITKIKLKLTGIKKTKNHINSLIISQNRPETVKKRKESLRTYWDNMSDEERERLRQINIESQNRPEVKEKISKNNPSKRPEVKKKQIQSALNRKKIKCPHCGKIMDPGNSKKYHFEKCKLFILK